MSLPRNESVTAAYQELLRLEYNKYKDIGDLKNPNSFISHKEILNRLPEIEVEKMVEQGLLIQYDEQQYRTTHFDLIYRLVNIRNLEHQRPLPLEYRIQQKRELVPDFERHDLAHTMDEIASVVDKNKEVYNITKKTLIRSYPSLSSYQRPLIKQILSGKHRHVAIVAPTASGKTLTFFTPVLKAAIESCVSGNSGVSSVLIYPRIALGRDQFQKLLQLIDSANELLKSRGYPQITIGIDDGDTEKKVRGLEDGKSFRQIECVKKKCGGTLKIRKRGRKALVKCNNCGKEFPYILPAKEKIWAEKPTILITNAWIVYRRLMDSNTISLFRNLDFVVVDEAHVYARYLGGHISYILRMLRYVASLKEDPATFLYSSATIPNPTKFISSLARIKPRDLYYLSYDEALENAPGEKKSRILLYLYLLPNPRKSIETLTEALILAILVWCHKYDMKAITFVDSIAGINTLKDYLMKTILGTRKGREITDHLFKTNIDPLNDYSWSTFAPNNMNLKEFREFVLGPLKRSLEMHYGGLSQGSRAKIEEKFRSGEYKLLLSTSTLELGIDLSDVAVIIQHKLPLSQEGVVQRVGRSGRNPDCYRVGLGVVALPPLPLSTLYMFDERLRGTLEDVGHLPPLKVGEISHNIKLQHTLSLLLLKRALEEKTTHIPWEESFKTGKQAVDALRLLVKEFDELREFNKRVKLFDDKELKKYVKDLRDLISPVVKGTSKTELVDQNDSTFVRHFIPEIDKSLKGIEEVKWDAIELSRILPPIGECPEDVKNQVKHISEALEALGRIFSNLREAVRTAVELRDSKPLEEWTREQLKIVRNHIQTIQEAEQPPKMLRALLNQIQDFTEFNKLYNLDINDIMKKFGNLGGTIAGKEDGILTSLIELLPKVREFHSKDLDALAASDAIESIDIEAKNNTYGKVDLFKALNIIAKGNAHFSLLLTTPAPGLELVGVDAV